MSSTKEQHQCNKQQYTLNTAQLSIRQSQNGSVFELHTTPVRSKTVPSSCHVQIRFSSQAQRRQAKVSQDPGLPKHEQPFPISHPLPEEQLISMQLSASSHQFSDWV
jgi:hypothetical protein